MSRHTMSHSLASTLEKRIPKLKMWAASENSSGDALNVPGPEEKCNAWKCLKSMAV